MINKVVFVALTSYQLYISDLYASYIMDTKKNVDVIVVTVGVRLGRIIENVKYTIYPIPEMNKNVITRVWQRLYWGGNLFFLTYLNRVLTGNKMALFVFNDNEPITNKIIRTTKKNSMDNIVSIIEEGIGIYAHTSRRSLSLKEKIRLMITTILGSPMQYKAIGDNLLIDYAIVGNDILYKSLNKASTQRVLQQSKSTLYSNSEEFLKHYSGNKYNDIQVDCVYLGQPFDEYGNLIEEEKNCIEKIISNIGYSRKILIKPHPRDAEHKYDYFEKKFNNVILLKNELAKLPIECFINSFEINCVISFNSSAGVNIANTFERIKCVFFIKTDFAEPLKLYWNRIGSVYDDEIYDSPYRNIFLPENLEEIIEIVERENSGMVNIYQRKNKKGTCYSEIDKIFQFTC